MITDLQYFGTISFIQSLIKEDGVHFDNSHPFSKMSFKNRMVIATAQGPLHLSIPIIGGRDQKTPIKEIRIAYDSPWNNQHFKAIVSNYQRSPYFEYYQDELKHIYASKPVFLLDFLILAHEWIKKQVKGKWEIILNSQDFKCNVSELKIINRVYDNWLPKNYHAYPSPIIYQQVFEDKIGFLPNLSILDLLFCCGGKQANQLLMSL